MKFNDLLLVGISSTAGRTASGGLRVCCAASGGLGVCRAASGGLGVCRSASAVCETKFCYSFKHFTHDEILLEIISGTFRSR